MPFELYFSLASLYPYPFPEWFCKMRGFASEATTYASILTITVFAFERWVAICYPLKLRLVSKSSRVFKIIAFLWFFAIVGASPLLIVVKLNYMILPEGYTDFYGATLDDKISVRETEFCAIDHYSVYSRNLMLNCSFWIFFAVSEIFFQNISITFFFFHYFFPILIISFFPLFIY